MTPLQKRGTQWFVGKRQNACGGKRFTGKRPEPCVKSGNRRGGKRGVLHYAGIQGSCRTAKGVWEGGPRKNMAEKESFKTREKPRKLLTFGREEADAQGGRLAGEKTPRWGVGQGGGQSPRSNYITSEKLRGIRKRESKKGFKRVRVQKVLRETGEKKGKSKPFRKNHQPKTTANSRQKPENLGIIGLCDRRNWCRAGFMRLVGGGGSTGRADCVGKRMALATTTLPGTRGKKEVPGKRVSRAHGGGEMGILKKFSICVRLWGEDRKSRGGRQGFLNALSIVRLKTRRRTGGGRLHKTGKGGREKKCVSVPHGAY